MKVLCIRVEMHTVRNEFVFSFVAEEPEKSEMIPAGEIRVIGKRADLYACGKTYKMELPK